MAEPMHSAGSTPALKDVEMGFGLEFCAPQITFLHPGQWFYY